MRAQARGLSGSFQAVGEAANYLAPELTGLADIAVTGARAFRGLGRSLASGNVYIIAATVLISAAIAAYALFTAATKREEESQKALNKALDENTKKIKQNQKAYSDAENAILSSAGKLNELRLEYALLSGDISKAEAAETKRAFSAEQAAAKLETQLQNQIKAKQDSLKAEKSSVDEIKKRIQFLIDEGNYRKIGTGMTQEAIEANKKLTEAQRNVSLLEKDIRDLRTDGAKRIKDQADEYIKLQELISEELKRQQQLEDAIARAKERQTQLQGILNNLQSQAAGLADRLLTAQMARMKPSERINAEYTKEIANLNQIEQNIIKQFDEAEKVARSKKDAALLTKIQAQKEAALASIQSLRTEAQLSKEKKIGDLQKEKRQKSP